MKGMWMICLVSMLVSGVVFGSSIQDNDINMNPPLSETQAEGHDCSAEKCEKYAATAGGAEAGRFECKQAPMGGSDACRVDFVSQIVSGQAAPAIHGASAK